jgi:hypothetical protein
MNTVPGALALLRRLFQQWNEESGEEVVAQVVGAHLHIKAVLGLWGRGTHHDAGVEDEDVETALLIEQLCGALPDRFQRGQIEDLEHNLSQVALETYS